MSWWGEHPREPSAAARTSFAEAQRQTIISSIISNLVGQAGSTSYTDTKAANVAPYFYRVGGQ